MLQDNPLLAQLKQKLHNQTPRVEGIVKSTDKNFGFLEVDGQKTYFIPPQQMKKVMHGDRIIAAVHTEKEREIAEPESLIAPFLTRFVARASKKDQKLFVMADHPNIKNSIYCRLSSSLNHAVNDGDWVIAEIRQHPLQGGNFFNAEITEFISDGQDHFAPWWITLARNQLEKEAPSFEKLIPFDEKIARTDFTDLAFFTIDGDGTEDMDDAIYLEEKEDNTLKLYVAIADPTSFISENSELDLIAQQRGFTHYMPGFEIPMLPKELSNNLSSLQPNEKRPTLVCAVTVNHDGSLADDIQFSGGWVMSKAKLTYNQVSDWIDDKNSCHWQPNNPIIEAQLLLLKRLAEIRLQWRKEYALVFKERPDYRFVFDEYANVTDIRVEQRRIAHRMIEEAMITVNICAAKVLNEQIGMGIFNVHSGFDRHKIDLVVNILQENNLTHDANELLTLNGFRQLRHCLDQLPSPYLDMRTRRYQSYAEMTTTSAPHFGLGLQNYATWTSPIRKYSDMFNHRLLKAFISGSPPPQLNELTLLSLIERKRQHRLSEREMNDWLYSRYLQTIFDPNHIFEAELTDITRGGARAKLLANGAMVFIPATFMHSVRDELICNQEQGAIQIKGEIMYRQGDKVNLTLVEVRLDTRNVIARFCG